LEFDKLKRLQCILILLLAASFPVREALAQGTQDPSTPPRPFVVQQGPLPTNTTPPTPNRVQRNIFSPGAPTPRAQRIYRRGTTHY
jgi:hypothetical protein